MDNLRKLLGKRIKEPRTQKNMKQHELAELLGIEARSVSRPELGYYFPKEENLERIAEVFKVSIKELFNFEHHQTEEVLRNSIKSNIEKFSGEKLQIAFRVINNLIS